MLPWAMRSLRTAKKSALVPITVLSRSRAPCETGALPTTTGAMDSMPATVRWIVSMSASVMSRAATPVTGGMPPVVLLRPGNITTVSLPMNENSPRT